MKIELIHQLATFYLPFFELLHIWRKKLLWLIAFTDKLNPKGVAKGFFLALRFCSHDLKNGLKSDIEAFPGLSIFREMIKNDFVGQDQRNWFTMVWGEEELSTQCDDSFRFSRPSSASYRLLAFRRSRALSLIGEQHSLATDELC